MGTTGISELSELELAVLRLVAEGLTNGQIAKRIVWPVGKWSTATVAGHVSGILSKLGVDNRFAAAARFGSAQVAFADEASAILDRLRLDQLRVLRILSSSGSVASVISHFGCSDATADRWVASICQRLGGIGRAKATFLYGAASIPRSRHNILPRKYGRATTELEAEVLTWEPSSREDRLLEHLDNVALVRAILKVEPTLRKVLSRILPDTLFPERFAILSTLESTIVFLLSWGCDAYAISGVIGDIDQRAVTLQIEYLIRECDLRSATDLALADLFVRPVN